MIPVKVSVLRKGDIIRFGAQGRKSYTVQSAGPCFDDEELMSLEFAERSDVEMPRDATVYAETMYRLVKVPCLVHRDDVELLCDMASGGTPLGVVCGDCDEKVTARAKAMMSEKTEEG